MNCPKCNKAGAYIRLTTKEIVCRFCGAISPLQPPKKVIDKVKKTLHEEIDRQGGGK